VVTISAVDLGQGLRTAVAQIGAEALGVPLETVLIDTGDTDSGPHDTGTFASRTTHRVGNAVIMAAKEARDALLEVAAEELEVDATDLETDGQGRIQVKGAPERSISVADASGAAHFKYGRTIAGRGIWLKEMSTLDPETGAMDPDSGHAHACCVADVEVDDETGEVRVIRLASAFEVGRAVNPAMALQQINGGAWMGMSHALYETTAPYYPSPEHAPGDFQSYLMPGPQDLPEIRSVIIERPNVSGPYGVKGIGEMTANPAIPAIANAVFDAIGVRITSLPITPEKVLAALDSKQAAE
jgi:CO/xanthine dehydrogenase Mo-binding subunit